MTNVGGGLIRIQGTAGNDRVEVSYVGRNQVRITDGIATTLLARADVRKISFAGGDGNDSISLST